MKSRIIMITRLTRREWLAAGGFKNPKLFRKSVGHQWTYWRIND